MKSTPEVPNKLFYKIGEVCELTDTQPYVLRFWESEFPQLAPRKNRSGQRVYQRKDIDTVLRIKKLLYDEEYTIAGVRTTLPFSAWILRHPRFISGDVSTDFIAEEWRPEELERLGSTISTENGAMTPETIAALASALAAQDQGAAAIAQRSPAGENGADGSRWRAAARRDGVIRGR